LGLSRSKSELKRAFKIFANSPSITLYRIFKILIITIRSRAKNGRFKPDNEEVEKDKELGEGIKKEILFYAENILKFWKLIPFVIILWIIWRIMGMTEKNFSTLLELACGSKDCVCLCKDPKKPL